MPNSEAAIETLDYVSKGSHLTGTASIVQWFDGLILLGVIACVLWNLITYRKRKQNKTSWKIIHPSSFFSGIFLVIHFSLQIQLEATKPQHCKRRSKSVTV